MQFIRFFNTSRVKNRYGYIDSQKKYEVIRTLVYFGISASLYGAGYIATKSRVNLLIIVAILGCLPASKSLVSAVMFLGQHSCSADTHKRITESTGDGTAETGMLLQSEQIYDLIFTTDKVTFPVAHGAYRARCLVLFSEKAIDTSSLEAHLQEYLKRADIKGVTVKVYCDLDKYLGRLSELAFLESGDERLTSQVIQLLKEITL